MPFVPSSQRLNTPNSSQIQVTEAINPIPTTQQQMINEDQETNNSQNSYENNNNNNNNNDLEDLLLTVLDELDTVKEYVLRNGRHSCVDYIRFSAESFGIQHYNKSTICIGGGCFDILSRGV